MSRDGQRRIVIALDVAKETPVGVAREGKDLTIRDLHSGPRRFIAHGPRDHSAVSIEIADLCREARDRASCGLRLDIASC